MKNRKPCFCLVIYFLILFLIMEMCVYMGGKHIQVLCPKRPEVGSSPGAGVAGSCEPPDVDAGN